MLRDEVRVNGTPWEILPLSLCFWPYLTSVISRILRHRWSKYTGIALITSITIVMAFALHITDNFRIRNMYRTSKYLKVQLLFQYFFKYSQKYKKPSTKIIVVRFPASFKQTGWWVLCQETRILCFNTTLLAFYLKYS